jgi:hypothetical protein
MRAFGVGQRPWSIPRWRGPVLAVLFGLLVFFSTRDASAYTWMLRHGYTGCATCHLDPSGGSVLTTYGRTVGGMLLSTPYGGEADTSPLDEFLFGAAKLPDWLMLGGDVRALWLITKLEGAATHDQLFLMQADVAAGIRIRHVLAGGSIGYAETGAFSATLTRAPEKNLVSRTHWVGYEFEQQALTLRAGRMNVPFGIRNVEHTSWARALTDTNINDDQQHGVAAAWSPGSFRGELMAILGNYQLRPDDYRERGYSGYLEWLPTLELAIGASSMLTHRKLDPAYFREAWRQQHGIFARYVPWKPLVLLAEANYVFRSPKQDFRRKGAIGFLQADVEPVQGLHLLVTGEAHDVGLRGTPFSYGAWFSTIWFLAPHLDVRIDNVYQNLGDEFGRTEVLSLLAQAHMYL